jgi:hypothetical protein
VLGRARREDRGQQLLDVARAEESVATAQIVLQRIGAAASAKLARTGSLYFDPVRDLSDPDRPTLWRKGCSLAGVRE